MAVVKVGSGFWLDMTWLKIGNFAFGDLIRALPNRMSLEYSDGTVTEFFGNFSYSGGVLKSGTLTGIQEYVNGKFVFEISGFSLPTGTFINWIENNDTWAFEWNVLSGNDTLTGGDFSDALLGFSGNDSIHGGGGNDALSGMEGNDSIHGGDGDDFIAGMDGNDSLNGGTGNDTIEGGHGADYILGMEGADYIEGGWGDDDINGNMGNDTVRGGDGADIVRGGQGNDIVYGDAGDDPHLNGNLGDDYVFGGIGNDTCYGGQGNDSLFGQEGDDWLSGDLGNDQLTGGSGADTFLFAPGGGQDWVIDFNAAEGDRLRLPTGTNFTLSIENGHTIVDLGAGHFIGLLNVAYDSAGDWLIFG